ncbi:MAG: hypothetical protein ACYCQJ_03975 [Nitrososphaerales archaeon]
MNGEKNRCPSCGATLSNQTYSDKCPSCAQPLDPCDGESTEKTVVTEESTAKTRNEDNLDAISCPHCGSNELVLKYHGVTRGDEDALELYECLKCGRSFRHGYGY